MGDLCFEIILDDTDPNNPIFKGLEDSFGQTIYLGMKLPGKLRFSYEDVTEIPGIDELIAEHISEETYEYKEENEFLKDKITELNNEIRSLINEKKKEDQKEGRSPKTTRRRNAPKKKKKEGR